MTRLARSGLLVATDAARTALQATRERRAKRKKKVLPNITYGEQRPVVVSDCVEGKPAILYSCKFGSLTK